MNCMIIAKVKKRKAFIFMSMTSQTQKVAEIIQTSVNNDGQNFSKESSLEVS